MAKTNYLAGLVVLTALALAASLLVLVAAEKPAQASFPGTNGLIAFVSDRDSAEGIVNDDIYVMNADGSKPTRLTSDPVLDQFPAVSPSGKEVAFLSNRDGLRNANNNLILQLCVMDAKDDETILDDGMRAPGPDGIGDNLRCVDKESPGWVPESQMSILWSEHASLSWSPDGKQIAFTGFDGVNRTLDVYVINADFDYAPKQLTTGGRADVAPVFSPDGNSIAFVSTRDSPVDPITGRLLTNNFDIYLMNADGSNRIRLTSDLAAEAQPEFSPDGQQIAFSSRRDGDLDIYVMKNPDGLAVDATGKETKTPTNLTNDMATDERYPAWSPDRTQIAFHSGTGSFGFTNANIWVRNADGSGTPTNLTYNQDHPEWGNIHPDWGTAVVKKK